jgi:two-component system, NarL family, nitrate/nitrite response regulator NarL
MEVVGIAESCEEAIAKIGELVPDVVLLDLDLGGKSSLDILPALLSNPVTRVLILTGERQQEVLDLAVCHGARGVLHKGVLAEQVLKAIDKIYCGELWLDHERLGRVFGELMIPKPAHTLGPEREKKAFLTKRERNIVHTIVRESGASNKTIAQRLFISESTLRNHLTSIYRKRRVSNRLELYVYAVKHGLGDLRGDMHRGNPGYKLCMLSAATHSDEALPPGKMRYHIRR